MTSSGMRREQVARVLQDIRSLCDADADPELEAVKAAVILEDVFGIHLLDNDIDPALLEKGAMEELLARTKGVT